MSRWLDTLRCGALWGFALLFACPATADESLRTAVRKQLRDENYLLIEDQQGSRLFVFSTGNVTSVDSPQPDDAPDGHFSEALEMTRNADFRTRVRGLTLLSDVDDSAALDAAMVLLSDPVAAVREEAVQRIIEHPGGDIEAIAAIARSDPSPRVRQAATETIGERLDDAGD